MMVLGGFITAVGIAAVAVAFTVLNATTLGLAGLAVAAIGAVVVGMGFFAKDACKKMGEACEKSISDNNGHAYNGL